MIPMEITPETYAQYFEPGPDFLIVQRLPIDYEKIGNVFVPENVRQGSRRFIGVGRVLRVSSLPSEHEYIEAMKEVIRERQYVCFEFHVSADVKMLPRFKLPEGVDLVLLHVRDAVQFPERLDELLEIQREYEEKQSAKMKLIV